jgi:CHAT domain-containing protein
MARFIHHVIFLLAFATVFSANADDPCPDPVEVMEGVFSVERSEEMPEKKIASLSKLLSLYKGCNLPKDSVYARILHRLGDLYRLQGDFEKGIRYTQGAISINTNVRGVTSRSFLTNSYYNLGLYHALLSYFEKSTEYFDSCIVTGKQYTDKLHIVLMAYEQKSFIYFQTGEYQKGIESADEGMMVAKKNNDASYQGILLQQKAQAQLSLGLVQEAESNAKMAIAILQRSDIRKEYLASAFNVYARVMKAQNNPAAAIRYYNQSIALNKEVKNWLQCSRDYMDLGYLYDYTLKDSARAIPCYHAGISVLETSPDPYQLAGLYNNLGVVYWRNGNYSKALQFYQRGLNSLPLGFSDTALSANPSTKIIKFISNDYFVATLLENKGESLLTSFKEFGNKRFLYDALEAFRAADKVIDQMRWRQVRETSKLYWRQKTRKMYESAIETCYLLQDTENAFFFFEKSRAVLLNDKLNELGATKILTKEDALEERELRSQLYSFQNSLQELTTPSPVREEVQQKWYATQQKLEKHIRKLEKNYPQYFHYKYDTTRYTLQDIRKILAAEEQTLIEYFTSDSVIYSLTIGPQATAFDRISFKSYKDIIEDYVALCSTPSLNRNYLHFTNTSNLLYERLFKKLPVQTKRVIVSFDDYFIPFESFLTNAHDKTSFLLRDHIFLYIYSAAYILKNNDELPFHNSLLGVAPVWYKSTLNLSPLRGAEISLKKIEACFTESFTLTKETATKQSFMENFPNYSIVHVYSHAMADYNDDEPMLYFHDEPVKLKDLQLLPEVKTQLLVLSGCRTGVGKSIKGEGVLSLARGFAAAGIPSTITTLWSVDDKVTYAIMEKFYNHLQSGMPSDEALQRAKIDFLDEHDGENELPYYWASSVALGKSVKMDVTGTNASRIIRSIFGILSVLSLAAFFLRKKIRRWTIAYR